jgi:hypothetical protein
MGAVDWTMNANAHHQAQAEAFAVTIAPAIREAQAAGASTLREIGSP